MEAYLFLLIFGVVLLLAAASLWFSKDPRKSLLMGRMSKKTPLQEAVKRSRQVASALFGVALALILFCVVRMIIQ